MEDLVKITEQSFESIKHMDESGIEFWYARELQTVLEYKEWRKFEGVIQKAMQACKNSGISTIEHFVGSDKTIKMPKGAEKIIEDVKLTRYACIRLYEQHRVSSKFISNYTNR